MNTTIQDDTASVIAAAEQILAGSWPAVPAVSQPCYDLPTSLPLVDDNGNNGAGGTTWC